MPDKTPNAATTEQAYNDGDYQVSLPPVDFPEAGDAILARTFMVAPAAWSKENGGFPQDYQIEVYYPSQGAVVHFTGIWREMNVSPELTMEGDIVIRTTVSQMIKWDDTTEKVCAEGLPAPG